MALGQLLVELEQALRNTEGVFTSKEANVFLKCRATCVRDFTLGLSTGAIITWLATKRVPGLLRLNLTAGVAFCSGMWTFKRASDNCVQHILSLEGTRLQKELGTIMLKKYQDDPLIMQRVSKYFYSEEVYDDASDKPRLRWRYRNFFTESSSETSHDEKMNNNIKASETSDQKRVHLNRFIQNKKKEQMNTVVDAMDNPFDCIFGSSESSDESHSDASGKSFTRTARGNKRSHRRHRKRHQSQEEAAEPA
ncbi:hypothetical protein M9H77_35178 [Catharanthus roseus]|uniref:Uncharacterized protein n=1 Tax=Catharanthus roseus TaxID=4058 RepID=A0ACB9ZNK0_CATRO|nr:hypothetical protein M9H77_35178 [Catharanthus roseus]